MTWTDISKMNCLYENTQLPWCCSHPWSPLGVGVGATWVEHSQEGQQNLAGDSKFCCQGCAHCSKFPWLVVETSKKRLPQIHTKPTSNKLEKILHVMNHVCLCLAFKSRQWFNLVLRFQSWFAVKAPLIDHIWIRRVRPASALRINFENRTLCCVRWIECSNERHDESSFLTLFVGNREHWTLFHLSIFKSPHSVPPRQDELSPLRRPTSPVFCGEFADGATAVAASLCLLAVCRYGRSGRGSEGARHVRLSAAYYYAARLLVEWILGGGRARTLHCYSLASWSRSSSQKF